MGKLMKKGWIFKLVLLTIVILCFEILKLAFYTVSDDVTELPCPPSKVDNREDRLNWNRSVIADFIIVGTMSELVYTIARRALTDGHRVTMMEHVEVSWPDWEGYQTVLPYQDSLKRTFPDTYTLIGTLNCNLTHVRMGRLDRYRAEHEFTHVIFSGIDVPPGVELKDRLLSAEHHSRCLSTAIESSVRQRERPHFSLLVDDARIAPREELDDCENTASSSYEDVLATELQMVTLMYNGLHSLSVSVLRMPRYSVNSAALPLIREELAIAALETSFSQRPCTHVSYDLVQTRVIEVEYLIHRNLLSLDDGDALNFSTDTKHDSLFTTYFTSKKDPQRRANDVKVDNLEYIEHWHDSVVRHELKGVIFHDGLTETFRELTNRTLISFHQIKLGRRSTNDERYYHYLDYLERHPEIENVLMTDVSDVVFPKNPFEAMRMIDAAGERLYVGEDDRRWPLVGESGWVMNIVKRCYGLDVDSVEGDLKSLSRHTILLNAGVVGGKRHVALRFLRQLTAVLRIASGGINCNMGSVNYIAHKYFDDKLYSGFPITSQFKKYDKLFEGYIIHK